MILNTVKSCIVFKQIDKSAAFARPLRLLFNF